MSHSINEFFASKIFQKKMQLPELNKVLSAMAIHHHERLGGLRPENHNIWDWGGEEIAQLKNLMIEGYESWAAAYGHQIDLKNDPFCSNYISHAWAQVYGPGGYARLHSHQLADATAIYYVTSHDQKKSTGQIELHDPRWVSDEMLYVEDEKTTLDLYPTEGTLLVFPGNLWHSVPAYLGHQPRICYVSTLEYSIVRRSRV